MSASGGPVGEHRAAGAEGASANTPRDAFLRACRLDVAVRKPGNVSLASAGHRMQAQQFIASAEAAAGPLFEPGASVGRRIEGAVAATWQAVGCNTNLGIVLLCAPLATAAERVREPSADALRRSLQGVLAALDVDDARAAYRAIAMAQPAGLGQVEAQDVHAEPDVDLREAMRLAADRDSIALQYANGFAHLFELGLTALGMGGEGAAAEAPAAAVQRLYLTWLATLPDSHIVRKHGAAVAQTVMDAAQGWLTLARQSASPLDDSLIAAWEEALKADGINPGTSADLTVATLFAAGLTHEPGAAEARAFRQSRKPAGTWHGT